MEKFFSRRMWLPIIAIGMLAMGSCDNPDEPPMNPDDSETSVHDSDAGVTFDGNAVIMGLSGEYAGEIAEALGVLIPNTSAKVDENTDLLIVPELSTEYQNEMEIVYNNGGIIAVTNPSTLAIEKSAGENGWPCSHVGDDVEHSILFSFNNTTHRCIVAEPGHEYYMVDYDDIQLMPDKDNEDFFFNNLKEAAGQSADDEAVVNESNFETSLPEDKYPEMYAYLHQWVAMMNEDLNVSNQQNKSAFTRSEQMDDVEDIFMAYPYGSTFPFTAHKKVNQAGAYKADYIDGEGSINVAFDVYQIHCYEDYPGHGDYYLVDMTATVANNGMYKGKWWNNHYGTYVRICGLYGKSFEIECAPVTDAETKIPLGTDKVKFTASGFPTPSTTVGKTDYSRSVSQSLSVGVSIGGAKDGNNKQRGGGANISAGWSWTKSESRELSDTDIQNNSSGNIVRYKLNFNNLPQFKWSEERGFDEGKSWTYRSTSEIRAYWIWHVPAAKDDDEEKPLCIRFRAKPTYGAMSFITTKADLKTLDFTDIGNVEQVFEITNFIREQRGGVIINNNFTDNTAIKKVSIYKASDTARKTVLWESKETIVPGKQKKTSAFSIKDNYMIYLTTVDNKEYVYSTYSDGLALESGEYINVYSATDFKLVE